MKVKNAFLLILLNAAIAVAWIFVVGFLDKLLELGTGTVAATATISSLALVAFTVAIARASTSADTTWSPRALGWALTAVEATTLSLVWALAYAEDHFSLPGGLFPAVLSVFGALMLGVSFGILGTVANRPARSKRAYSGAFSFGPVFAFWLGISYLAVLLALAVVYNSVDYFSAHLKGGILGGILPIGVPWYGALGAVTISIYGVFRHNDEWKTKYNFWHVARPLVGAVLGMIAFFIFVGVIKASQSEPLDLSTAKATDLIIYYVLAFIVGYREETFRALIKSATDLLLKPGGEPEEGTIELSPSSPIQYEPGGEKAIQLRNLTGATIVIPADAVTFVGGEAANWQVAQVPEDPAGKDWWSSGETKSVAKDGTIWFNTVWNPTSTGPTETTTLQVAYTGTAATPKSATLIGTVPEDASKDDVPAGRTAEVQEAGPAPAVKDAPPAADAPPTEDVRSGATHKTRRRVQ